MGCVRRFVGGHVCGQMKYLRYLVARHFEVSEYISSDPPHTGKNPTLASDYRSALFTCLGRLARMSLSIDGCGRERQVSRRACNRCHTSKLRCPRSSRDSEPCGRCAKAGVECIFDPPNRLGRPRQKKHQRGRPSSDDDESFSRELSLGSQSADERTPKRKRRSTEVRVTEEAVDRPATNQTTEALGNHGMFPSGQVEDLNHWAHQNTLDIHHNDLLTDDDFFSTMQAESLGPFNLGRTQVLAVVGAQELNPCSRYPIFHFPRCRLSRAT